MISSERKWNRWLLLLFMLLLNVTMVLCLFMVLEVSETFWDLDEKMRVEEVGFFL